MVAAGYNIYGQSNVDDWTDIVAVATGDKHTVGVHSDGTVVATGSNEKGECDVVDWTDITAISTGSNRTLGLRSNGTVAVTSSDYTQSKITG